MRKSSLYLTSTAVIYLLLSLLIWLHPTLSHDATARKLDHQRLLVGRLGLTDICLFTEASYLRHPSLADGFVPFQNHPMAMSHFPSEGLLPPPRHLLHKSSPIDRRAAP